MESSTRGRATTTAAGILLALALFGFLYGRQIATSIYAWKLGRDNPGLYLVPQPLPLPKATTSSATLSYFGYEFDVPWGKPEKEQVWTSSVRIVFKSGVGLFLTDPATNPDLAAVMRQTRPQELDKLEAVFGRETLSSTYGLLKKEYSVTPSQVRPFGKLEETVGTAVLLVLKSIHVRKDINQAYSFEFDNLRGFVLGNPESARLVTVDGFGSHDLHFQIMFFSVEGASQRPSLAEIAFVLQSIRPSKQAEQKK